MNKKKTIIQQIPRFELLLAVFASAACVGRARADSVDVGPHYEQINLVSDISGAAQVQDTNLVNAWGISFGPGSPFWISDNGTGKSTLYSVTNDASGAPHAAIAALVVTIPGQGNITGQFANDTTGFNADLFIFASEDGTLSGWRPALGTVAETLATRATAVYKGLTLATNGSGPVALAANFREATIDVFGANGTFVGQFSENSLPAGYAPFNVQNVSGVVFVTFAKQDAAKHDDVPALGRGAVEIFDPRTGKFQPFAIGKRAGGKVSDMDSPWGVALAPSTFGKHANQLLVGNFGSGSIMAFDMHGNFRGLLTGSVGLPVVIDGLWALTFGGHGSSGVPTDLYFTAGPFAENHGLFGVLQAADDHEKGNPRD